MASTRGRRGDRGGGREAPGEDPPSSRSIRRWASRTSRAASSPSAWASPATRSNKFVAFCAGALPLLRRDRRLARRDQPAGAPEGRRVMALDAKLNFDDNALYRHKDIVEYRDVDEEDPTRGEGQGVRPGLHRARRQHRLHGERRRSGDGHHGHHQAGGRSARRTSSTWAAARARRRSPRPSSSSSLDPAVKAVLDQHLRRDHEVRRHRRGRRRRRASEVQLKVPLVVRLEGTNVEQGKEILRKSGLPSPPRTTSARRPRRPWPRPEWREGVMSILVNENTRVLMPGHHRLGGLVPLPSRCSTTARSSSPA